MVDVLGAGEGERSCDVEELRRWRLIGGGADESSDDKLAEECDDGRRSVGPEPQTAKKLYSGRSSLKWHARLRSCDCHSLRTRGM